MPRRVLKGIVVSSKVDKTVVVSVERYVKHAIYKKFMKRSKKYMAHDERNFYKDNDSVQIVESKPISKRKRWEVVYSE